MNLADYLNIVPTSLADRKPMGKLDAKASEMDKKIKAVIDRDAEEIRQYENAQRRARYRKQQEGRTALTQRQLIAIAYRALTDKQFTHHDIVQAAGYSIENAHRTCRRLIANGFVKRVGEAERINARGSTCKTPLLEWND